MTERKFTPPTSFPAEYIDELGLKVVLYGRGYGPWPLIGQNVRGYAMSYDEKGARDGGVGVYDLHDIPKRITTWHNIYVSSGFSSPFRSRADADAFTLHTRLCVYRIERDEDGGNPEIFVEDV